MIDKINALEKSQLTTQASKVEKVNWLKRKLRGWIDAMPELENTPAVIEYFWRLG